MLVFLFFLTKNGINNTKDKELIIDEIVNTIDTLK